MCRCDVEEVAVQGLVSLMASLRDRLSERYGVDPDDVVIGPIDFGKDTE